MTAGETLSSLNSPALTTAAGAVAASGLSTLQQGCMDGTVPWKVMNLAAFGLSLYTAQQPGRLDGKDPADIADKKIAALVDKRDSSLFVPQNWAFSIWPAIFLGELIMTAGAFFLETGSPIEGILQEAAAGFAMAQVFQTLWALSFRPKYLEKEPTAWISAAMLTGIAASLAKAHDAFDVVGTPSYLLFLLPMSLHFGWTSAAALVNWNGNVAMLCKNEKFVTGFAWTSTVAAAALGVFVTVSRQAPIYGGVVSWALAACAGSMHDRVKESEAKDEPEASWIKKFFSTTDATSEEGSKKGVCGAKVQKWLCAVGAAVSGTAAIWTALQSEEE